MPGEKGMTCLALQPVVLLSREGSWVPLAEILHHTHW